MEEMEERFEELASVVEVLLPQTFCPWGIGNQVVLASIVGHLLLLLDGRLPQSTMAEVHGRAASTKDRR